MALTNKLTAVANAIRAKTGKSALMTLAEMPAEIAAIPSGGFDYRGLSGVKFKSNTDTSIDLSTLDTSSFTSLASMFQDCSNIQTIDLTGFDTSSATSMVSMFQGCTNLSSVDFSSFNTSKVKLIHYMFSNCKKLTNLDLSAFNTSIVTNMTSCFDGCTILSSVNLQSFTTPALTNMTKFLYGSGVTDVIWAINSTTVQALPTANAFDKVSGTVPSNLNIWVRDSLLTSYQGATNWSRYSACFKPISQLPAALQTLYDIDPTLYP